MPRHSKGGVEIMNEMTEYLCPVCDKTFNLEVAMQERSKDGLAAFPSGSYREWWAGFMIQTKCPHCGTGVECCVNCKVDEIEVYMVDEDGDESCDRFKED